MIITHHAPSIKSINKMYSQSTRNQYYATNLDEFILDKNPYLWVHGHCHTKTITRLVIPMLYLTPEAM